jgi:osmoprotectant transport system substrate-binding protein
MNKPWRRILLLLLALTLVASACGDDDEDDEPTSAAEDAKGSIVVGSANFDESTLVASMYSQVLAEAGYDVREEFGIGNREVYFGALEAGEVDVLPEFLGSLTAFLGGEGDADGDQAVSNLEDVLPEGLELLAPSPADSANVFVVTKETAEANGLSKVSDLAGKDLTLGGPPECPERPYCMIGLETVYGVDFSESFKPLDVGGPITKEALSSGDIDVALLFSTDPGIVENDWVILEDDKHLQPAENVTAVIRSEVLDDEIRSLLDEVAAALDQDTYVELLGRVYIDGEDSQVVAKEWLEEQGLLG